MLHNHNQYQSSNRQNTIYKTWFTKLLASAANLDQTCTHRAFTLRTHDLMTSMLTLNLKYKQQSTCEPKPSKRNQTHNKQYTS